MIQIAFIVLGSAFIGFVAGTMFGDWWGTKDTERRWSEAVVRAEDRRKYPT